MGKSDKGRPGKLATFTPMLHHVLDCPAFLTLTPLAECIYWRLVRLSGVRGRHNGDVFLSVRQVAKRYRVGKDTAGAAFHLLQARGFIRPREVGRLGMEGEGKATTWVLTQWGTQNGHAATKDFLAWQPGQDFPVKKGRPPAHAQKPVLKQGRPVPIQGRKGAKDAA